MNRQAINAMSTFTMAAEYYLNLEEIDDNASAVTNQASNESTFTTIRLNLEVKVKTHQEIVAKVNEVVSTVQEQTNAPTSLLPWNTPATKYGDTLGLQQLTLDAPTQKKYIKDFRWFEAKNEPQRFYVRILLKVQGEFSEYFLHEASATLNSFDKTDQGGWVTYFRAIKACSDAINPHILCYIINLSEESTDSELTLHLLRVIGGDDTLGLKFAPAQVPKNMKGQVNSTPDWLHKRVMQVEGERATGTSVVKNLQKYFKNKQMLGSRVIIVDLSQPSWTKHTKQKRAFKEGLNAQILLNQRLCSVELDDVKLFASVTVNGRSYYIAQLLMQCKATRAVMVRGNVRKVPLFHSITILGSESAVLHYLPHSDQEAVSISQGFPVWMETVLGVSPHGYCSSSFISYCNGGTWDTATGVYTPPASHHDILEFVEVDVTNVQAAFLSSQENNALAREEDDLTAETKANPTPAVVNTDNVSLLSNGTKGTENTATLTEKNKSMMETNATLVAELEKLKKIAKDQGIQLPPTAVVDLISDEEQKEKEKEDEMKAPAAEGVEEKDKETVEEMKAPAAEGVEEKEKETDEEMKAPEAKDAEEKEESEKEKVETMEEDPTKIPVPTTPERTTGVSQGLVTGTTEYVQNLNGLQGDQQQEIEDESMKPVRSPRGERDTPAKSKRKGATPPQPTPSPPGVNQRVLRSHSRSSVAAQKSK
ncbi:predicted protein [Chaetoceros tenuissimus]|uniref:Uncharacterized protein n=1 Tax=Chaetoceros tenuissimus TaxID=426638 RepID=A0AAD3D0K8_9STRA|nr:predicted protein [Chaetoceros tenuissimus]